MAEPVTIESRSAATEETVYLRGPVPPCESGIMLGTNGTTNFLKVKGGTPLGRITASQKLRPCGKTTVSAGVTAVNVVVVDESELFFTGDTVGLYSTLGVKGAVTLDGDGASLADIDLEARECDGLAHRVIVESPTLGVLGAVTINADGAGNEIDLSSRIADGFAHTVQLVDPSANDRLIRADVTVTAGVAAIAVSLATGGAGAITSTVADVIDEINASSGAYVKAALHAGDNAAATVIAVAATPLAGSVEGADEPVTRGESAYAAATDLETVTVILGLNHERTALEATVQDVIEAINAASHKIEARAGAICTPANAAIAIASTPLAGAVATAGAIATARTLTKSGTSFTLSGAAFTCLADDILRLEDGSQTAIGILFETRRCDAGVDYDNGGVLDIDPACLWHDTGIVNEDAVPGVNALIKADLPRITFR